MAHVVTAGEPVATNHARDPRGTTLVTPSLPGMFAKDRWGQHTAYSNMSGDGPDGIKTYARGTVNSSGSQSRGLGFHLAGNPEETAVYLNKCWNFTPGTQRVRIRLRGRCSVASAKWIIGIRFAGPTEWIPLSNVTGKQVVPVPNQWTTWDDVFVVPEGAIACAVYWRAIDAMPVGATFDATGLMFEENGVVGGEYFDGNTHPHDDYVYKWESDANRSISTKRPLTFTFTPEAITYTEAQYRERYLDPQVKVRRRVEILESNGATLWEGATSDPRLIAGSVSIDYTRDERRSLDIELANFDRKLIHKPGGFWYDKVIKVYRGIEFRDAEGIKSHEVSLGKFMIDRTTSARFPATIKVTARDYTKKALLSKFPAAISFAKGTNIVTVIAALAANSGIYDRLLPSTSEALGTDLVFERGATRWSAMKQIAEAFNYELFFDAQGYLVMRKFIDPTLGPISHQFLTGPKVGNLIDWGKSTSDTRLFNHVTVIGTSDAGVPIRSDAINNHPGSPTAVDKIGDRVFPFESSVVTTQAQCDELAASLLAVNQLEEYEINITSLVSPWVEAGEIFQFADPDAAQGDPDRFLISTITIPVGLEAMTATGRRVTIVGGDY